MRAGKPPRPGTSDIELSSGDYLNLAQPDARVITPEVVAHHLANVCRYAGAVRRPYSVAEHTIIVAAYLEHHGHPTHVVMGGLHHDDPEAFLGDATRPLKEMLPDYRKLESSMGPIVERAIGLEYLGVETHTKAIKEADNWALAMEAWFLMPSQGRDWWCWGLFDYDDREDNPPIIYTPEMEEGYTHLQIKNMWLAKHRKLYEELSSGRSW